MNETHGTVNSATSGYHETITRAYVQLLSFFTDRCADKSLVERLGCLLDSTLADRAVLLTFYSSVRLMSTEARLAWLEPDLAPIGLELVTDGCATH